jgi:hypothetical protein
LKRAATTGKLRTAAHNRLEIVDANMNAVLDETITAYLPELRSRLGLAVDAQPESSN